MDQKDSLIQRSVHRSIFLLVLSALLVYAPVTPYAHANDTTINEIMATGGDGVVYLEWNAPHSMVSDYIVEYCTFDACQRVLDEVSPCPLPS